MRVLLTGHLGFIGTVLAPMLLQRGHQVTGLDSNLFDKCTFGAGEDLVSIPEIRKDIRDITVKDVTGFDAVLHLAGLSNDPLGDLNPEVTFDINHRASVRLAKLCQQAGVPRFVFSSSCSNYGASGDDLIDETGDLRPVTPYAESKILVEQDVSQLADESFSSHVLTQCDSVRLFASIAFRPRGQQSDGMGHDDRTKSTSKATARLGDRSSTFRTSRGPLSRSWKHRGTWCGTKPSTFVRPAKTT